MSRRRSNARGARAERALAAGDVDQALAEGTPEAALQSAVEGLLRFYGWRYLHVPANAPRTTRGGRQVRARLTSGFPDLLAIRRLPGYGPELLVAELKAEAGRYGPGQREWLADLEALVDAVRASGKIAAREVAVHELPAIAVYTWRPSDLHAGTIEDVLEGPAGRGVLVDNAVH